MSYSSPEQSIAEGRPIELYRITTTAGADYRFTNAENSITDDIPVTYTPASVSRDAFSQSQQRNATETVIRMPYLEDVTDEFAQQYIPNPPEGRTTLTIKRHHLTDTGNEFVQIWEGTIVSAAYDDNGQVELLCRGYKNLFAREGPQARWAQSCQHQLYDGLCGITATAFSDSAVTVDDVAADGVTLTLSGLSSPLRDFVGGRVIKGGGVDSRLIVDQSGNVITIQQPFRSDFVDGATVSLEQGCDHSTGDCINKFSNIDNFGGFPYTPGLNPYQEGLDKL